MFLSRAESEGVRFLRDGDRLRVIGPPGVCERPAVVRYITRFKSELVALLPDTADAPPPEPVAPEQKPATLPSAAPVAPPAELDAPGTEATTATSSIPSTPSVAIGLPGLPGPTGPDGFRRFVLLTPEQDAELFTLAAEIEAEWRIVDIRACHDLPDWGPLLDAARAGALPVGARIPLGPGASTTDPNKCALAAVGALRSALVAAQRENPWVGWEGIAEAEARLLDTLALWHESGHKM